MNAIEHAGDQGTRKRRAALLSIFASAGIALGKLVAGLMSGSLALISEAGHAALDTGATVVTWLAVRAADKPADEEHHYGHGKFESAAALVETGLLFVLAVAVAVEAVRHMLQGGGTVVATPLAFSVLTVSILVDLTRWRALSRIARETGSDALAADALHFSSDLVSSLCVVVGLLAALYGFRYGDALAALAVAAFIAIAGYRLGRRTLDALLDTAPKGLAAKVRALAARVPGVVDVGELRLRPVGPQVFGEIAVTVPRTMPLERVAEIKAAVADAIRRDHAGASVAVTTEPVALDDETVRERVMLIAARRHLPVHHVTIQEIGERLSVSLDLEVDGRLSLSAAHEVASKLEAAIRDELGPAIEVETHIEPMEMRQLAGADAPASEVASIETALRARAAETDIVRDIHNVRVRKTPAGLVVNYHCRVDPNLDVSTVHGAVDHLESLVRAEHPRICRVVGHTEPQRVPSS
jgi:cation diffusion facilitator family transporter